MMKQEFRFTLVEALLILAAVSVAGGVCILALT
jgi:hypothetical protein